MSRGKYLSLEAAGKLDQFTKEREAEGDENAFDHAMASAER